MDLLENNKKLNIHHGISGKHHSPCKMENNQQSLQLAMDPSALLPILICLNSR